MLVKSHLFVGTNVNVPSIDVNVEKQFRLFEICCVYPDPTIHWLEVFELVERIVAADNAIIAVPLTWSASRYSSFAIYGNMTYSATFETFSYFLCEYSYKSFFCLQVWEMWPNLSQEKPCLVSLQFRDSKVLTLLDSISFSRASWTMSFRLASKCVVAP